MTSSVPERSLRHFVRGPLLIALAGAILIALDPLGIEEATAQRAEKTVMRMSSALYPPLFSKPSEVTIVLLDQPFVERHGGKWPVRYDKQGELFELILKREPAALFVDLLYRMRHVDASVDIEDDAPGQLLARIPSAIETPIYLAVSAVRPAACRTQGGLRPPLAQPAVGDIQGPIRRELSNLKRNGFALIEWHGCPDEYPMYPAGTPQLATPAYALYTEVKCMRDGKERSSCLRNWPDGDFAEPMKIRWSAFPPASAADVPATKKCQYAVPPSGALDSAWRRVTVLTQEFLFSAVGNQDVHERLPCPAINVVSANAFFDGSVDRAVLDAMIHKHFVLIGADVPGSSDIAVSPVHGQMPGVMVHGMALDNLLRYEQHYVKPVSELLMLMFWNPVVLILVAAVAYRVTGSRLQRPLEIAGLLFLAALATNWWTEGERELALLAISGGALLFVIAPTAVGRAAFWFAFICLAAVSVIELGHAPTNYLVLAIAAVLVGEKVYHEMNGAKEKEIVEARLGRIRLWLEWALGVSKNPKARSSGEISHEVESEIRVVRVRSAWYLRFRNDARGVRHDAGGRGHEQQ